MTYLNLLIWETNMNTEETKTEEVTPRRGRPPQVKEADVKSVDNAILTQLLDKMNRIQEELVDVKAQNKRLESIAGNAAIADYNEANRDKTQKLAHFKVLDGKTIVAWRNTKNEVKKVNGTYVEDIRTEVEFIDGLKQEIDFTDFIRCHTITKGKIKSIDHKAGVSMIEFPTGETKEIPINFLNA